MALNDSSGETRQKLPFVNSFQSSSYEGANEGTRQAIKIKSVKDDIVRSDANSITEIELVNSPCFKPQTFIEKTENDSTAKQMEYMTLNALEASPESFQLVSAAENHKKQKSNPGRPQDEGLKQFVNFSLD